jgi:hypothetical protein
VPGWRRGEVALALERAIALKQSDPAVKAGRHSIVAVPWMVPGGAVNLLGHPVPDQWNLHPPVFRAGASCAARDDDGYGQFPFARITAHSAGGLWPAPAPPR